MTPFKSWWATTGSALAQERPEIIAYTAWLAAKEHALQKLESRFATPPLKGASPAQGSGLIEEAA